MIVIVIVIGKHCPPCRPVCSQARPDGSLDRATLVAPELSLCTGSLMLPPPGRTTYQPAPPPPMLLDPWRLLLLEGLSLGVAPQLQPRARAGRPANPAMPQPPAAVATASAAPAPTPRPRSRSTGHAHAAFGERVATPSSPAAVDATVEAEVEAQPHVECSLERLSMYAAQPALLEALAWAAELQAHLAQEAAAAAPRRRATGPVSEQGDSDGEGDGGSDGADVAAPHGVDGLAAFGPTGLGPGAAGDAGLLAAEAAGASAAVGPANAWHLLGSGGARELLRGAGADDGVERATGGPRRSVDAPAAAAAAGVYGHFALHVPLTYPSPEDNVAHARPRARGPPPVISPAAAAALYAGQGSGSQRSDPSRRRGEAFVRGGSLGVALPGWLPSASMVLRVRKAAVVLHTGMQVCLKANCGPA
jgi:hypothetical protein